MLEIQDLSVGFYTPRGPLPAVRGLSLSVAPGEVLGVVGESGCGKSVTALAAMGLLERNARVTEGRILWRGRDLLGLDPEAMRRVRGAEIAMIFQEPMTALNPVMKAGDQIAEALLAHRGISRREARATALEMLRKVAVADPERRLNEYPHKLSGGLRQRVMIAMALACRPALLIADEPTTALDVTVQAQLLDLLRDLRREFDLAMILITHDLAVVAQVADRIAVMYAGRIVETGPTRQVLQFSRHPYTRGLLGATPPLHGPRPPRLISIPGAVPDPLATLPGCWFEPRCTERMPECLRGEPGMATIGATHQARCLRAQP